MSGLFYLTVISSSFHFATNISSCMWQNNTHHLSQVSGLNQWTMNAKYKQVGMTSVLFMTLFPLGICQAVDGSHGSIIFSCLKNLYTVSIFWLYLWQHLLIFAFLVIFTYLLGICISSFENCPCISFAHFCCIAWFFWVIFIVQMLTLWFM